jgi:hypothetical protein
MVAVETGPSGYETIALIAAGIGAITGISALVWNIAEFRLTGPRVKGQLLFGAVGPAGLVSTRETHLRDWQTLARQGFVEPLVGIEVVNSGRASTQVHHFSCRLSNGFALSDVQLSVNQPIPFVLEPHRSERFWLPAQEVKILVESARGTSLPVKHMTMEVEITGPKTVSTKSFTFSAHGASP